MAEAGITPEEILRELAGRHVIDKKKKQERETAASAGEGKTPEK
jgi:hypothetical protein